MTPILDVEDIRTLLPHRYPMLLVDRILELEPGEHIVGLKNVTINEPFFDGHFPGQAVMPGVLIIEAMAQVAGLMLLSVPGYEGKLVYIAEVENIRFRRPIIPGDTLETEAHMVWLRRTMGKVRMVGRVDNMVVVEGVLTFATKDPPDHTLPTLKRSSRESNGRS